MLLSAAAPLVALIDLYSPVSPPPPLVPGLLAVPVRYATSLSVLPRMHGVAEQLAVVVMLDSHLPSWPIARSCSEASTDPEERVSIVKVEVHSPPSPSAVRSRPP